MRFAIVISCAFALALCPGTLDAASITGMYTAILDADFDLTALGTSDWAYWATTSNPASGVPTNSKLGGTLISNISAVGGGNVRGSTSTTRPVYDFVFTDGTTPTMGTADNVRGLFNTQLDMVGAGVALDLILPTTGTHTITLWVSGFNGAGELTASLSGATDYVNVTPLFGGDAEKDSAYYTLTASPDTAGDILNLSYILNTDTGSSSHVLISGVAISPAPLVAAVPEPSTWTLASVAMLALGFARRRQRRT
jgi:hypothetical protein